MEMAVVLCLLLRYCVFAVTFLGTSSQLTPIKEDILDSTTETNLQWISEPPKAWEEIKLKLGLASAHTVYQGCHSKLKNTLKTLWTKWIAKKDAHELQLDLLFAQDDQIPLAILLLESDTPVEHPHPGQKRQEIVAPQAFIQSAGLQDVETHLFHAQGLDLGKITRNGFHLGFSYSGSCMFISSVRVFYMKCPGLTVNQTSFRGASAGSGWIRGQCVDGAEEVSTPKIKCESNGQWSVMQGFCVCGAGYQTEGNVCKACGLGSYKAASDSGECQLCPFNSRTSSEGASECDCEEGYARLQDDPPQLGCTRSPSAPLNLTVHHLSNTALILNWATPADLGGRREVMYDVECRQNTGESHAAWVACDNTMLITPKSTGLTETVANITGLQPHVSYQVSVRAYNRISQKLGTSGAAQSITIYGRVRIWHQQHEAMDPTCLVSTVQAGGGGVMVWGMISWHTLGPLIEINHRLIATAYFNIVANHVHPFMATIYPSSNGYFQYDNAPCHKAKAISIWFHEHDDEFSLLQWPFQSPNLNPVEHLWDVVEQEIHSMKVHLKNL